MNINDKIKEQRLEKGLTMQALGNLIGVDKAQIYNWENGKRNPKAEYLLKLSTALQFDFVKFLAEQDLTKIGRADTSMVREEAVRLVEPTVMEIPLVSQYAYAGYLDGYQDTTYMTDLPKVPFNVDHYGRGKYLAFEVRGDSMTDGTHQSILNGDILMCREVYQDHWKSKLHINKWTFVIVHRTEGVIIKKIIDHDVEKGIITIHSLNPDYPDQKIDLADVKQLFNVLRVDRKM